MADELRADVSVGGEDGLIRALQRIEQAFLDTGKSQESMAKSSKSASAGFVEIEKSQKKADTAFKRLSKSAAQAERDLKRTERSLRDAFRDPGFSKGAEASFRRLQNESKKLRAEALKTEATLKKAFRTGDLGGTPIPEQRVGRFFDASGASRDVGRFSAEADAAFARINNAQKKTQAESRITERRLRDAFRSPKAEADALGGSLLRISNLASRFAIVGGLFALQAALRNGVESAIGFENQLAEIQTISGTTNQNLDELSDIVREISDRFAVPIEQVAEGTYQTLSNQVTEAGRAFQFLEGAQRFAIASVSSTGAAVDLLSSALNSFNIDASRTGEVAGKFFRAIELGRFRAEDLANTFGRVADLSDTLGVSLDETLASLATLTTSGLKANEAITLVTNAQLKLIKPTEDLRRVMDELGIASAEVGIQIFGFQGFLEKVTEVGGETAEEIGKLFGRVRAIRGVLGLATDRAEEFQRVLAQIQESGDDTLEGAFERIFETRAKQVQQELNEVRNLFVEGFGRNAVLAIDATSDALGGATNALAIMSAAAATGVGAYIALSVQATATSGTIVAGFGAATASANIFRTAVSTALGPIGIAVGVGAAIGVLITQLEDASAAAEQTRDNLRKLVDEQVKAEQEGFNRRRRLERQFEAESLGDIQRFLAERQKAFQKDADVARDLIEFSIGGTTDQIVERFNAFDTLVSKIRDTAKDAGDAVKSIRMEVIAAQDDLAAFTFERSIRGTDELTQSFKQIERSQELARSAQASLSSGDVERAKALQQQSEQLARQALSSADQTDNLAAIRNAESQVTDTIGQRQRIAEQELKRRQEAQALAEKQLIAAEKQVEVLGILADRLGNLSDQAIEVLFDPSVSVEDRDAFVNSAQQLGERFTQELNKGIQIVSPLAPLLDEIEQELPNLTATITNALTEDEINVGDALVVNFDRVRSLLRSEVDSLRPEIAEAFASLGISLDERGFAPAQQSVADLTGNLRDAENATLEVIAAQGEVKKAVDSVVISQEIFREQIKGTGLEIAKAREGFFSISRLSDPFSSKLLADATAAEASIVQRFGEIQATAATLVSDPNAFNLAGFEETRDAATTLAEQLEIVGASDAAAVARNLARALNEGAQRAAEVQTKLASAETLTPLSERIQEVADGLGATADAAGAVATANTDAVAPFTRAEGSKLSAVEATNKALESQIRLAAQAGSAPSGAPAGGAFFGSQPLFRASGGATFRPRGQDRFLTVTSAGEGIVKARAMRNFFPQVQAINADTQPVFREQGGAVNTNVGPISITVNESRNPQSTVRELVGQFNRETRRKTSVLRRR